MRDDFAAHPEGALARFGLNSRREAVAFFVLLAVAVVYFVWRGPMRGAALSVDLPSFYSAARAWLFGGDPYDMANLTRVYAEAGGDAQPVLINVNPPMQFPLLAWLAVLPYPVAKLLFVGVNLAAAGLTVWRLAVVTGLNARPTWAKWLVLGGLLLAPVHTTISQGQLSLLVVLLVVLMLEMHQRGRDGWAGLCLALAGALKPQMVILFGLYYLLTGRWRAWVAAGVVSLLLLGLAVGRMEWAGVDWLAGWRGNMEAFVHAGTVDYPGAGYGDYTVAEPSRFIMIHLAPLLYPVLESRTFVNLVIAAVGVLAVGTAVKVSRPGATDSPRLLTSYAVLSVACLLMFYNRTYSATLLLLPLGLALTWWSPHRRLAWLVILTLLPFIVPGPAIALRALDRMDIQPNDALMILAEWVLLPHQIYALSALLALLLLAEWRPPRRELR